MIRHIRIRNFAIIENADIQFHHGLNIITGETGSGKSIVIEAVSLALGSRADTAFVRSGCDKATIQMIADYDDGTGLKEYIISREISSSGRNICRINDEIVTLSTLSALCSKLADIHGQYDHQSLLNRDNHIHFVDLYRKDEIAAAKDKVSDLYEKYNDISRRLSLLKKDIAEGMRQKDFMEYELKEILDANLSPGEDEELEEQILLMQNGEKIYSSLAAAYELSSDGDYPALSALKQVWDALDEISAYGSDFHELSDRVSSIYYEYEDICHSIREFRDQVLFDPNTLDKALGRADYINRLKTKHGKSIDELLEYAALLDERLANITDSDQALASLEKEASQVYGKLLDACDQLTSLRKESGQALEQLITDQLMELNFSESQFRIDFDKSDTVTENGNDTVEFLITTNRGEPLKPLSKIASGGEMSRIMLAFKKILGDYDNIPTMIFDEIDSGISGIAASVVGRKLLEIAERHQIICITHLPQIAACGKNNYRISKHSDEAMTYTTVDELSQDEKVMEIARLLGGDNITDMTLASARELIEAAR